MILAEKIVRLRKKNGWSQEELAEQMKVSRQSVSKWEGAISVPDLDKILQLSRIFGVSTDYLLKEELEEEEYSGQSEAEPSEAVRRVTLEEANEFLTVKRETAPRVAFASFLCIISPICLLLLGGAAETGMGVSENLAGGAGMIVLLLLVAAAVAVFISCGMKTERFEYLDKEIFETEYGVSGMVEERKKQYKDTYTRSVIMGTCICILSVVPLFACAFLTENGFYLVASLSGTLLFVAIGVVCIIPAGINWESMQKLLQEGSYSKDSKMKGNRKGAVGAIYWLIAVALYLGISFYTNDWKNTWIIWPVAGVLFAAVMTAVEAFGKREDNKQ